MVSDYISQAFSYLNTIPSPIIGLVMVFFFVGYLTGGIFTANSYWGRIWRGFVAFVFASYGLYDLMIMMKGIFLFAFLLGFAFNVREYIHAAIYWVVDLTGWAFKFLYGIANAFLKLIMYIVQGVHDIIIGFSRVKMFSWEAKLRYEEHQRAEASASRSSNSSSSTYTNPDVEAARRAREEDLRRQQAQGAGESQRREERTQDKTRQEHKESPPPPRNPSNEELRREAARVLGIDPILFTYEDLKQAHRKKLRQLHPDQYEQLPEHIKVQLDDEMKAVNAARDYLKKWKGWK